MNSWLILLPVLFPIAFGGLMLAQPKLFEKKRNICTFTASLINLGIVLYITLSGKNFSLEMLEISDSISLLLRPDSTGRIFAVLVSALWPLSMMYSYEYMKDEERQNMFFAFYMMTLGSVMGIALAGNIVTLYIFYEILTLLTFPLVMHNMTDEAMKAGREYLIYMLGGAAFAFIGVIFVINYGSTIDFIPGGVMSAVSPRAKNMLVFIFFITFCGFSVKAAMMPFGKWLIHAAVAPMPITALLHAVAVVKSGAFAIIRLIYYVYGAEYLKGTWAQYVIIVLTSVTILYGSIMSVKEPHLKRRMAYSTISNLSYILFGAALMSPLGFVGSISHLVAHAVTKIGLFFVVGAIMRITGKSYIYEIGGIGHKMKLMMFLFTMGAISLIGIPPFAGFVSKMRLIIAAIDNEGFFGYLGAFTILFSALMTAIYLMNVVTAAYFPAKGSEGTGLEKAHDPSYLMTVPIAVSAVAALVFGIVGNFFVEYLIDIAEKLI